MRNIKKYKEFLLEYITLNQGANLSTKDPIADNEINFDGGDGPSASNIDLTKSKKEKPIKKLQGNNAKEKQKERKKENKKRSKIEKINQMGKNLTNSDQNLLQNNKSDSAKDGGAGFSTQGF